MTLPSLAHRTMAGPGYATQPLSSAWITQMYILNSIPTSMSKFIGKGIIKKCSYKQFCHFCIAEKLVYDIFLVVLRSFCCCCNFSYFFAYFFYIKS